MKTQMLNRNKTLIGAVESVTSNSINIKLDDSIKSNMQVVGGSVYKIGLIGSFIKIPLGYAVLYGIVTKVGAAALPDNILHDSSIDYSKLANQQWINAVLIGEQVGKRFDRGVTQYPTTGDIVHLVTNDDLIIVYGNYDESNTIVVGSISASENLDARINLDKLIARHCAILGSTGSGKSNAVSVMINAIVKKNYPSSRVLIIDPHGEYEHVFDSKCSVLKVNDKDKSKRLVIPYWCLQFEQLLTIIGMSLPDQNIEYVREKVLKAKSEYNKTHNLGVEEHAITADSPIPYSINQIWYEIDRFERTTYRDDRVTEAIVKNGNADNLESAEFELASMGARAPFMNPVKKGLLSFCDLLRNRIKDNRFAFLFNPLDYTVASNSKTLKDIDNLLLNWIGSDNSISVLDLSGVPAEIIQTILGTLLKIINDALFWGQNLDIGGKKQPLLVVLEEAHLYLKTGETTISSDILHSIAKEGRKYGIGLLLSTQRPSELDETVLSQCGTIIALRMTNDNDKGHIKSALQDQLHSLIDLLPSIRTGEAIISGEAVNIPARIKFYKSKNAPKSEDPVASLMWQNVVINKDKQYKKLSTFWRNQQINLKEEKS